MGFVYSIAIQCDYLAIRFAALFSKKAKNWLAVRKQWYRELSDKTDPKSTYCWIHCASAGEFEQAIPLVQAIRSADKSLKIAVSFFSSSGFELFQDSGKADLFFHSPIDSKKNQEHLIALLKPVFVLFIRNEIWWNTLTQLKMKGIPTYLVNAPKGQKRSFFYQIYLNNAYSLFTKIFDTSAYGNTKLEKVLANRQEVFTDKILDDFCNGATVILAGSSWQTEEISIASFYQSHRTQFPVLKIIIAPHEYDENKADELEKIFSGGQATNTNNVVLYSRYTDCKNNPSVLFLDKKGMLKYAYRYAKIAVIGGGFDKTVHNVSEAAVYGIPTLFGPNYKKFEEITDMVNRHVAFSVNEYAEFENKLLEWLSSPHKLTEIHDLLDVYFEQQEKVAERIIAEIFP